MADVFLLIEGVWIFLLIVEVIDGEIQFATPADLPLGKVWFGRKGFALTIPCVTEENPGDKYMGAMYNWHEKLDEGKGLLGFRRTIYGNGTLTVVDLQTIDTGMIICNVSKIETSERFIFPHSIVVYYVAEFSMTNPFVYTVPNCDEVLTVNKLHDLLEFTCNGYRGRSVMCPFTARKDCSKKTPVEVSESSEGAYRLRIIIEQQPEKGFVVPDCSMKCMKKSIIGHLQQYGDDLLRRLAKREDRSQGSIYKGYVFEKEELLNRRIKTSCYGGFELFQFILCMPCFPGTYIKYSYQFDETQTFQSQCLPCDYGYYQEKFAMDECLRCPFLGKTSFNATADVHNCTTSSWSIAFAYYAIGGILAVAIIATCIGMWVVISRQKKQENEALRKLEEEQRSGVGSAASSTGSRINMTTAPSMGTPVQQSSNNVNVNRRFSSSGDLNRDRASPFLNVVSEAPPLSESFSTSSSESDRRPMLQESSPAIMQSTLPRFP